MSKVALSVIIMLTVGFVTGTWVSAAPREQVLRIEAGTARLEFAFNPVTLTVRARTAVRLEIVNNGRIPHDFVVEPLRIKSPLISPGRTATLRFRPTRKGTFQIICSVPGHKEAGMVGSLVVR